MTLLLLSVAFVGFFFLLMSVRILFLKGGEFRGTCASQSPWLVKNGGSCSYCGKPMEEVGSCDRKEPFATRVTSEEAPAKAVK